MRSVDLSQEESALGHFVSCVAGQKKGYFFFAWPQTFRFTEHR
jgi:hypothetical protein